MTSVSAGYIMLTLAQPVWSGHPWGINPQPPDQESLTLKTELPRPPLNTALRKKIQAGMSLVRLPAWQGNNSKAMINLVIIILLVMMMTIMKMIIVVIFPLTM